MSTTTGTQGRNAGWALVVGAVVLALLGAAWWLVWDGREAGAAGADGDDLVLAQADDEDESGEGDEFALATIEVTYDFFLARDPFESIRPPEPVAPDPTDPTDPTEPTDPTDPTEPVDPGPAVEVLEVTTDADGEPLAVLQVGTTVYQVGVGDQFAGNVVLAIEDDCVTWAHGDSIQTGCVGDTVK